MDSAMNDILTLIFTFKSTEEQDKIQGSLSIYSWARSQSIREDDSLHITRS